MSKKALLLWCLAIGLIDAIYCIICTYVPHVQNYMWIAFISLPLFFTGTTKFNEVPKFICCSVSGVLWGALSLIILGSGIIQNINVAYLVIMTVIVTALCYVHMGLLGGNRLGGLFSHAPMVFGGFAAIFSQGIEEIFGVMITLALGVIVGWIMAVAASPITKMVERPSGK